MKGCSNSILFLPSRSTKACGQFPKLRAQTKDVIVPLPDIGVESLPIKQMLGWYAETRQCFRAER
eukprot:1912651-Amphidinium_carterae.1